jgi:hypothetical protein
VKLRSSSTSDLPQKIVSPERTLVLPPVFDTDKFEALSVQLETVYLNGVCTIDLLKTLLDTVHKLSEDVAILKSDNASLKNQISQLNCKVHRPQGSKSSSVGFRADTVTADSAKAAHHRNPARSYAAVAVSGSAHIVTPLQESADREPPLEAWSAVSLLRPSHKVSTMQVDHDGFTTVGNKKKANQGYLNSKYG